MAANIRSYGDLTAEGVRDAVWNALGSSFTATGTMGALVNDGGGGGGGATPEEIAAAVWALVDGISPDLTPQEAIQLLVARFQHLRPPGDKPSIRP
jgi:hypothetical protein